MKQPTQRTLEWFRKRGVFVGVVERYSPYACKRFDLLGFIDLVAVTAGETSFIIGVQATSGSNMASRVTKIVGECAEQARAWLKAGGRIQVFGWRQIRVKKKNGDWAKVKRWEPNIVEIDASQLNGSTP